MNLGVMEYGRLVIFLRVGEMWGLSTEKRGSSDVKAALQISYDSGRLNRTVNNLERGTAWRRKICA